MQEIVWQIVNDIDLETVKTKQCEERMPFLEIGGLGASRDGGDGPKQPFHDDPVTYADNLPMDKPRVIKSHLTFELLPPRLLDTCKVVYVCRNPKDAIVSYYKMHEMITPEMGDASFEDFADLGSVQHTCLSSHLNLHLNFKV